MNPDILVLDNPELTAQRIQEQLRVFRNWRDARKRDVDTLIRSLFDASKGQLHKHLDGDGSKLNTLRIFELARQLHEAQEELHRMLRKEQELLHLLGL